jgi:GT2 family glycosyltransferase
MFVSVIVPTLNREKFLIDTLNDLLTQNYDNYEIIVVDQSNELNQKVKEFVINNRDRINYYYNVGFKGLPSARNFGLQHSKGDILIFIDDDVKIENDFITNHIKTYYEYDIGAVAGGIDEAHRGIDKREPVGFFNYWTATPKRGFASQNPQFVSHVPGGNFSVKREAIESIKGFDEHLNFGAALYEETDFSLRLKKKGFKIFFNPQARLLHLAASTGGCRVYDVEKYMRGLAHNRTIIIKRHLSWFHLPTAYSRLLLLGMSYSKTAKSLKPFKATLEGINLGKKSYQNGVKITNYKKGNYCII